MFNKFIKSIKESINRIRKVLKNEEDADQNTIQTCKALLDMKVPDEWQRHGFISIKTLYPWVEEVSNRANFFEKWIK